ncbi:hypothetical protein ACX3VT_07605 [Aerococcus sanguinicola]|uniref:hypothetical protein n=1 Tax=unclassified Aerococcus TaxID=2618060 RepID=UPI0008A47C0E|nr:MULTISPECIES: hypothetical protein [unclassified Aerococcus]KAB0646721.1 hypothetical protein F6I01_05875 [Aerococcus sanguinicola]MDK6233869.1 hypothetical protein [Aerococcus sp. UMB10185]MDK6805811.1 hypothetical protein [Aerococcus sp. UMB7834]MDK6856300.1 hypothetical protein [Aerococcus sp. UMB7533]OFN00381.1 hypothetical protein HMPREF2626_09250 [Aerococcus sp. HMSC062A02]
MHDQQFEIYKKWRQQMLVLDEAWDDDSFGQADTWSASNPLAREDFNETLAIHSLDHVSQEEMQAFEDDYDAGMI